MKNKNNDDDYENNAQNKDNKRYLSRKKNRVHVDDYS